MDKIQKRIPDGFFSEEFESPRLRVRPYDENLDIVRISEMFADLLIYTQLGFCSPAMSEEKIRLSKCDRNENRFSGDWTIFTNDEGGDFVGEVGISYIDFENETAGIFETIGSKHSGKAYGREASSILIGHIFDNLSIRRIRVEALSSNERAVSLAVSLGFQLSGMLYLPGNPITGFRGGNGIILDLARSDFKPFSVDLRNRK